MSRTRDVKEAGSWPLAFVDGAFEPTRLAIDAEGRLRVGRDSAEAVPPADPAMSLASETEGRGAGDEEPGAGGAGGAGEAGRDEGGAGTGDEERDEGGAGAGWPPAWTPLGAVVIPGFVNAHSHAFQRLLRGRVEGRAGDFWSWRERMYHAVLELDPDDVRVASRAAFLEMLLAGFTSVVEFHYLHHGPSGKPYADPNEIARAVLEAASDVGIRILLLETAYARAGTGFVPDPAQKRFLDPSIDAFLDRAEALQRLVEDSPGPRERTAVGGGPAASFGLALHSVRALPRDWLVELAGWAEGRGLPVHMHVAEQVAEVEACLGEHGRRPVELLDQIGVLGPRFTAVHAIHVNETEIALLARSGSGVCACPSTEANLGDGFVPAARFVEAGVPMCLGTDSHASIDPFSEMREIDYRERLRSGTRQGAARAAALLGSGTSVGAARAGWDAVRGEERGGRLPVALAPGANAVGRIREGYAADLVVLDAADPSLRGASPASLPETLFAAGSPRLVRDVYVQGRRVVEEGRHARQEEILRELDLLQRRLWREG